MIYLGIDSGTQSTKTIALDTESGAILASAQSSYGFIEGLPEGHLEQDPLVWIKAMKATIESCLHDLGERRAEIKGIGVSGQQHGLVALDADRTVIRPAKLWCDTSTVEQCQKIESHFGGVSGLIELIGNAIPPGFTAPKILWLKENEPANYKRLRHVQLPHDYLNSWLSGELRMEYGDASGTGLLEVRARQWCKPMIDFIDPVLMDFLPAVQSSAEPCGFLRKELCQKWGLSFDIVISSGGGDNMMGAIGTGNTKSGVVTASFGTSGTLYAFSEKPVIDFKGEIAAFCDSTDHWLPLVCTMNVTVATEKIRQLFNWDLAALESAVESTPAGSDGILFLPYLNGERTPNLANGTGVFHGLTMHNIHSPNMARATMEGVTLGLAYGLQRFRDLNMEPREIRLTGGGSKSAVWRQIAADVFGVPVVCLSVSEGAATGAALQAAWTVNRMENEASSLSDLTAQIIRLDEKTRCFPDADAHKLYVGLLKKQTDLTRKLHASGYL